MQNDISAVLPAGIGFGDIFIAICLLFFAFSTILSWHFFGAINTEYLFGKKSVKLYSCVVVVFMLVGSMLKVDLVWELAKQVVIEKV